MGSMYFKIKDVVRWHQQCAQIYKEKNVCSYLKAAKTALTGKSVWYSYPESPPARDAGSGGNGFCILRTGRFTAQGNSASICCGPGRIKKRKLNIS